MNTQKRVTLRTAAATLLAGLIPTAWSHSDKGHGGHGTAKGAATKDQKPWGIAGDAKDAKRTVEIAMNDQMRFVPDRIAVKEGETIRLTLRNTGKVMHELVLGTKQTLDEHAAMMKRFPKMEHDEPYMAHVAPGKSGQIVWQFNRNGQFSFACLIAGHYEAGMVGTITVSKS